MLSFKKIVDRIINIPTIFISLAVIKLPFFNKYKIHLLSTCCDFDKRSMEAVKCEIVRPYYPYEDFPSYRKNVVHYFYNEGKINRYQPIKDDWGVAIPRVGFLF